MSDPLKQAGVKTTELASLLGLSPSVVTNWKRRGFPAEKCPEIERVTQGRVRCETLRPDVEWAVLRCQCKPDEAAHEERGSRNNELQEA